MFSNNTMSIVIINIYFLIVAIVAVIVSIYYSLLKNKINNVRYDKTYNLLKPFVLEYIKSDESFRGLKKQANSNFKKEVVIDILLDFSREKNVNLSGKFENLGYHNILIRKMRKKVTLKLIRDIAQMQTIKAYKVLKVGTTSEDFEIKYMSFYALSMLKLNSVQLKYVIQALVRSGIMRDRIIEILLNLNLSFNDYMELFKAQQSDIGKIVFLRVLEDKEEMLLEENSDRIMMYLQESKEVRISTVLTLAKTKNNKYLQKFKELYLKEEEWEVRSAIAKGLRNFKSKSTIEILKIMINDTAWWVKFNAAEALIYMGNEGINVLIDLSLNTDNKKISDLAYYFLNADKEVYKTITDIEVLK